MDPKFHFQSAHCYFILAGDDQVPVVFNVINERTGTSYAKRIVRASQNGKTIFSLIASFAVPEQSQLEYQVKMPKVLFPHEFKCEMESGLAGDERSIMFHNSIRLPVEMDVKVIPTEYLIENSLPSNKLYYWMRSKADLPPDQLLHSLIAAYISDYEILNSSLAPYGLSKHGNKDRKALTMIVSLDHAIWLHQPFKADEWHLFELQVKPSNTEYKIK
ncbi:hypothetical protein HK103_003690 [Boothiomyces macroporosus]|uniref:Uncharacterized protein n=1 Tax=Boothiomyces macroporosus TaxID=261099 RepID=A0AAD5Y698_9FUNG|nr:hypothetical protein HK103_003690 [Boothiomyces macroporosus]